MAMAVPPPGNMRGPSRSHLRISDKKKIGGSAQFHPFFLFQIRTFRPDRPCGAGRPGA